MLIVKSISMVMIVSVMLGAGMEVDWEHMKETLHEYALIAKAMLVNFILLPLVALLLVRYFHVGKDVATGIVLMAMAPGVPFLVNAAGRGAGGSHSFALTVTFLFAALSVVTIPITIWLIASFVPDAPVPSVPAGQFLTTLIGFQLVPLGLGAFIGPRLAPATMVKIVKLLHLLFIVAALVLLVLIFQKIVSSVTEIYGDGRIWVMLAIAVFGAAAGWLLGGPKRQFRRTLSIASLLRNVGLCVLIGSGAQFAGTLVIPTIFTYFIVSFVLSLPIRMFYKHTKDAVAA